MDSACAPVILYSITNKKTSLTRTRSWVSPDELSTFGRSKVGEAALYWLDGVDR